MRRFLGLFTIFFLLLSQFIYAWELKLESKVEIQAWKLSTKSETYVTPLAGATIKLLNGVVVVKEMTTDPKGNFTMMIPQDGEFTLEVSYPGCNSKIAYINTKNVPDPGEEVFKPIVKTQGFTMSKPFRGIDYSALKQPLLKIYYSDSEKKFIDDKSYTQQSLDNVAKISSNESDLIQQFCNANKAGDEAMKKNNCPEAKIQYEKAKSLIDGENYPDDKLQKVGECLKQKELADQKLKEEAAKKAAEEAAKKKSEADLAKKKEEEETTKKKREEADRIAKEKAAKESQTVTTYTTSEKTGNTTTTTTITTTLTTSYSVDTEPETTKVTEKQPEPKEPVNTESIPTSKAPTFVVKKVHSSGEKNTHVKSGKESHHVRSELGADAYEDAIKHGDQFMESKQYKKAMAAYEEALKHKPKDEYAKTRFEEAEKLSKE